MNPKRQTVWLVSMLSLMVVLSAYYLFTEDVNQLDFASTGTKQTNEIKVSTTEHSAMDPKSIDSKADPKADAKQDVKTDAKVTAPAAPSATSAKTDTSAKQDTAAKTDAKTGSAPASASTDSKAAAAGAAKTSSAQTKDSAQAADAKVLEKMQAQAVSGGDFFVSQQLKRNEDMGKQTEKLMTIITDAKQSSDTVSKAYEDLRKLEDKEAKITNLEESLMKDFPQVIVNEDLNKWKVTVQSNKLERSQAVSIVDSVMKEMNVGADGVIVQYVP
ncbi:SpoIIIAH-like family protein [Paenibacillus thalictri]|uniref:SpoIIIAH-like family protein n=1 Tax=Paenibacillus thalictri TaxID=2527873 RepID=A0A4Q9DSP1_9BACL|nr:SpoIIIAH-like family protein [Paenibacillus thalictri]TBL79879.1 SpoIIIAH-like family protein [Paenibacillus thalictri]